MSKMSRGIAGKEMCSHERESRYEKEDMHEGKMIAFIPVGPLESMPGTAS